MTETKKSYWEEGRMETRKGRGGKGQKEMLKDRRTEKGERKDSKGRK